MEKRVKDLEEAVGLMTKILEQHSHQIRHLLGQIESLVKLYGDKHQNDNEKFL
jgi:hypothetical protein